MNVDGAVDECTLVEQVVLLGVASGADEAVRPDQVRRSCNDRLTDATGRLSEADVSRALNTLTAQGLLDEGGDDERSPVGKGRPAYTLAVDDSAALDALADQESVAPLVASVRE